MVPKVFDGPQGRYDSPCSFHGQQRRAYATRRLDKANKSLSFGWRGRKTGKVTTSPHHPILFIESALSSASNVTRTDDSDNPARDGVADCAPETGSKLPESHIKG